MGERVRSRREAVTLAAGVLALGLGLPACVTAGPRDGGGPEPVVREGAAADAILVRVVNDTDFQIRVYAVTEVDEVRLGVVGALRTETLELPATLVGGSRRYALRADPVGSARCYRSDDVFAGPGDVIEWRLWGQPRARC